MYEFVGWVFKMLHLHDKVFSLYKESDSIVVMLENGKSYRVTVEEA